jgi:bis(5'-nucleosyl)-tetraphosphatase (symmetrical)
MVARVADTHAKGEEERSRIGRMHYLIGDVQGCNDALGQLLDTLGFSPSRDSLTLLGDLVNRGPDSLGVVDRAMALGASATAVLGNHDLHCLAVASGAQATHHRDTLQPLLARGPQSPQLLWLRQQPLAHQVHGWLCVHAGVSPLWSLDQTLSLADEVARVLQGPTGNDFLRVMHGDSPKVWQDDLVGADRWRHVVNVLTRIRFCNEQGQLDLRTKEGAAAAPPGMMPWFNVPLRRTLGTPIAFGHWSTLGLIQDNQLLALDTGCVWGGQLTAMRVDGGRCELTQVPCTAAQKPG